MRVKKNICNGGNRLLRIYLRIASLVYYILPIENFEKVPQQAFAFDGEDGFGVDGMRQSLIVLFLAGDWVYNKPSYLNEYGRKPCLRNFL